MSPGLLGRACHCQASRHSVVVLWNSGLVLSTLAHVAHALSIGWNMNGSFTLAAMAEVSSVLCFGIYIWARVGFAPPKPL